MTRAPRPGQLLLASLTIAVAMSGGAGLLFLHLVLPATSRSWAKHDFDISGPIEALLGYRMALSAGIVALMVIGVGSGRFVRSTRLRAVILIVCALVLMAIAATGILGWWMMYVDLYRQASEM